MALLLLAYLGLAIWLTWPLAASLAEKLPCTTPACPFDTLYGAWVMSWLAHAATTTPWSLGDANIYSPDRHALYYGPAGFGTLPFALPTFVATGNAATALNVTLLASVASTALALHWVVRRWTGSLAAAFVAAWALLMNRWYLWGYAASTTQVTALPYFPLIVFLAAGPLRTRGRALVLLALVVAQCLTDLVYVTPAVIAPLAVIACVRVIRRTSRPSGWRLIAVLAGVPVCLAPFVLGYVQVRRSNPALAEQTLWNVTFPFSIQGIVPTDLRTLLWQGSVATSVGIPILVLIALGGAVAAWRAHRGTGSGLGHAWRHAAVWAIVGIWISLSPAATWGPQWIMDGSVPRFPLPQYLLALTTPLYEIVRIPVRLGVSGMIGMCLLAGLAAAELFTHANQALRVVSTATIVALVYFVSPAGAPPIPQQYPLQSAPSTPAELLDRLRANVGPVLELPLLDPVTRNPASRANAVAMYRSTFHWRPLVNGYTSYWPAGFIERVRPTEQLPDPAALWALVCSTGVRTILVNLTELSGEHATAWQRARERQPDGLRMVYASPMHLLFEVTLPPPGHSGVPTCPSQPMSHQRVARSRPPTEDVARSSFARGRTPD